ncbi:hypothetical protein K439DRAFT_105 [Ramaria rubella]|nr:hypothetical protein K439DRAFT_105 [Ramaria rubella]
MPHIDFQRAVVNSISAMTRTSGSIDQPMLRDLLMLAPAYLIIDNTIRIGGGLAGWAVGFHRLVDVLLALHAKNQLETETVNAASKACSECWSVSGMYRGLTVDGREVVRNIAGRLKTILDKDGKKYKGERVYAP